LCVPSPLQRLRDPVQPLVDRCDLMLQRLDLRAQRRIEGADRRAAAGALNDRKLPGFAERCEQRQLESPDRACASLPLCAISGDCR
jgi:hypothetical protein